MNWFRKEVEQEFPPYYPKGMQSSKKKGVPCLLFFEIIFSIVGIVIGGLFAFWLLAFLFVLFL